MPNKIVLKKSSVASKVPVAGDLDFGELAINYTDGKLYFKKADNSIDAFTTAAASAPVTSVGGNIGDITDSQLLASIKNVDGAGSGLDADTLDGNHASAFYLASNPNGYTSNTGTVTSVGATAPLVSSGGTAPSISIPAANSTTNGYMTSAYASKLDGIAAGATANTGTVTSVSGTGTVSGLTLSGTVTGSGSLTLGGTLSLTSAQVTTALGYTPYNSTNPNGYITSSGSITGSSGSVSGLTLTSSLNGINPDSVTQNQLGYNTSVSLFGQTDGGLYSSAYNSSWIHQIYGDFRTGQIAIRGKNSGTWQAWRTVLDSSNYTSYSPSLTGGGASGTWGINITGSAASANQVAWNNVSGRPGWLSGGSYIESHSNANDWRNSGFYENGGGGSNWPSQTWYNSINVRHNNQGNYHGFQIAMSYYDNNLWFRSYHGSGSFQSWAVALSNQNYSSYAVRQDYNTSLNSDTRNTRGVTRLYRRDDNSDYSVQTYWTGSRWRLYGYNGDSGHADTHVGYADNADTLDGYHASAFLRDNGTSLGGSSGYTVLSNGLIIQWAMYDRGYWSGNLHENGESISFPITFPNACRSITVQVLTNGNNNTTWTSEPKVYSYNNSSWKRTGDGHRYIFWIAIGY